MMQHAIAQGELVRVIAGLFFVLVLIVFLSWVVKRLQQTHAGSKKGFQFISSMFLGPKEKITLLKAGQRYLLVGSGSGQVNLLYDFGEELPVGFETSGKLSFAELLKSSVAKTRL